MSAALFDLTGKRALITGSSQGIGATLAEGLKAAGAEVVLNGRDAAKLSAAAEALGAAALPFDVTDHAAARAAVDGFEAATGPIDILVNNAGMQHRTPLEDFAPEDFERLIRTNLTSVFTKTDRKHTSEL
ncbi:MAG: SDR family NAD(P)-dependent oxidoreductase, partial [Pseudomonadota bacterium]